MKKDLSLEAVLSIYDKVTSSEQNFNKLQIEYRKLASGWLLAVFGGIGFLLSTDYCKNSLDTMALLVFFIGLGGHIGICLIWLVDLVVYHRLLRAYFLTGLQLEYLYHEILPPTRSIMRELEKDHGRLVSNVILFYFISSFVCLLISATGLIMFWNNYKGENWHIVFLLLPLIAIGSIVNPLWRTTRKREAINNEISDSVFTKDEILDNMFSKRKKQIVP